MKRLPLLLTLVLAITGAAFTGIAGTVPAAAGQGADSTVTIPLGGERDGSDRLAMPLFEAAGIVPGDSGTRTVAVRNDGPANGVLTASIINVEFGGDPADPFYEDLLLNGEPVSGYLHRETTVLTTSLDRGERTTLDLSYQFPEDAVSGNNSDGTMNVSFDVLLQIRESPADSGPGDESPTAQERPGPGDRAAGGTQGPVDPPDAGTSAEGSDHPTTAILAGAPEPDDDGWPASTDGPLAETGTDILWIAGAGLLLTLAGLLLIRRRRDHTGTDGG
ncbi:LPXTG cell wall anchor domain-containing protein [Arthrobacter castelli]|uniref:LPXTG cell wall anchor domain-containing protein n=1 Tax=Arthrobacter castelli TaxID=271431 RepID=UPI0003FF0DA4|nr:LPXTG cell wall anchor domain-containing protein [Arthrobacter castelli]